MDEREFDEAADCIGSYYAAVAELRRRYLAGEELPEGWRPPGYKPKMHAMSPWDTYSVAALLPRVPRKLAGEAPD